MSGERHGDDPVITGHSGRRTGANAGSGPTRRLRPSSRLRDRASTR